MRTYQRVNAANGANAAINSLIFSTAWLWMPALALIALWGWIVEPSADEKAKMLASGKAGYEQCRGKNHKKADEKCKPHLYGLEPEKVWTVDNYGRANWNYSEHNRYVTPQENEAARWKTQRAWDTQPWDDLKCNALASQIRKNVAWAKGGDMASADKAKELARRYTDHQCKVVAGAR